MDRHYQLALSPSHTVSQDGQALSAGQIQGASKKTSFCENGAWQILLLIMRNQPSFFLTNAADDTFCNSFVYHLVGLHIGQLRSGINTTSSLKNDKSIWDNSSQVPIHLLDVREGLGILLVFAKAQYGFLTASSIIYHDQFSLKESTLYYMVTIMRSS